MTDLTNAERQRRYRERRKLEREARTKALKQKLTALTNQGKDTDRLVGELHELAVRYGGRLAAVESA
jgi:hypothetical protein